jgi:hypothetical protein
MGNVDRRDRRRGSLPSRARWAAALILVPAALVAPALGQIRSKHIGPHLCETRGGGKFVPIPGFPGEKIDRRLLPDVKRLVRKYDLFVTDGYSMDPVHDVHGEHPLGLAIDVIPDKSRGGSWHKVTRLAHRAEPEQDHPRPPYRWVGYNGDAGHGRGNHLHLSWMHSTNTKAGHPTHMVITRRCPDAGSGDRNPPTGDRHRSGHRHRHNGPSGGVSFRHIRHETGGIRPDY